MFTANRSSVLIDGEPVEALQSLTFRVVTEREDIHAIGNDERVGVSFGPRSVLGEMVVRSHSAVLDGLLQKAARFQIVANLKKEMEMEPEATRTIAFDGCFVEGKSFGMDASGTAATTYAFKATRIREE